MNQFSIMNGVTKASRRKKRRRELDLLDERENDGIPFHRNSPRNKVTVFYACVMVNFICQLDEATGYPDIWLNIILVCERVFLDEINI